MEGPRPRPRPSPRLPQSSACPVEYTSLKDIIPWQTPYDLRSGDSWRQIPIKDPLLQQAAWAYLLPSSMSSQTDDHRKKGSMSFIFLSKLMDKFRICFSGCLGEFLEEVCWSKVRKFLVKNAGKDDDGENDYDGDLEIIQESHHGLEI